MIQRMNINAGDVGRLRDAIAYDPATGLMRWKARPRGHFASDTAMAKWNGKYAGRPALTSPDPRGYRLGCFDGKNVWAHRAAWALHYGEWPGAPLDHVNRDKGDNRIENLRLTDHSANALNSRQSDNPDRCIYPAQRGPGWRMAVKVRGKMIQRTFSTRSEARAARDEIERLRDSCPNGIRNAADDVSGVLGGQEEETRPVPVGDVQAGRGGVELLALRARRRVLL